MRQGQLMPKRLQWVGKDGKQFAIKQDKLRMASDPP